ncbi:MAG: chorismate mutase [Lachnospiraceae bacterium]|nr:chorismate mutase [Lachnospiraceae bacterium]
MDEMKEYRENLAEIDKKMAGLFEERMKLARKEAEYRKENGLSVRDPKVEEKIISDNKDLIGDDDIRSYYVNFMKNTIDLSCDFQEQLLSGMKVAYSGVEGAFAYIAAKKMYPKARLISCPDFLSAYKMVEDGQADCAVLPMENSLAGEVGTVMDLMYSGSLFINQVLDLPIRHHLLGLPGSTIDDIKTLVSHPQALNQCVRYTNKKGYDTRTAVNTAVAAKDAAKLNDKTVGVIASEEAADLFGLIVLDHDIQDSEINSTRFAAFSRSLNQMDPGIKRENENFILVFTVKNEAGALASTLNIIGVHGYNMRSLKSRPMKDLQWNYYFYIEAEGNINTRNGKMMLQELSALCGGLKLVGTYH